MHIANYDHHQKIRASIDAFLADASAGTSWNELARRLLPDPAIGLPLAALRQHKSWASWTLQLARGHLERKLGRGNPQLAEARRALEERAIRVTMPITLAASAAEQPQREAEAAVHVAREEAARIANLPSADAAARHPISGARPYHAGSQQSVAIPDDPIPYAWRDRAMRLVTRLFAVTRDGRKQGILKQSGVTVLKALMLNFANGKTGACFPSYEAIAARTGLGRSTVAEAVALLADLGFLEVTNRTKRVPLRGRGGAVIGSRPVQTSNSYRLGGSNWLAIAAAAPAAAQAAVAEWFQAWRQFLLELKSFLLKATESRTRTETDPNRRLEGKTPSYTPSPASWLKRVCRLRARLHPDIASTAAG